MSRYKAEVSIEKVLPFVSVIICAKDAENTISSCLESILDQDYAHFEVLVVDDFSTDATGDFVRKVEEENENLHILRPSKNVPGKKLAIHEAVQKAQGEWILMTDADCMAQSNQWIKEMVTTQVPNNAFE